MDSCVLGKETSYCLESSQEVVLALPLSMLIHIPFLIFNRREYPKISDVIQDISCLIPSLPDCEIYLQEDVRWKC